MMGRVDQVSPDGAGNKGPAELNYHIGDEHKEVRDGIVGEGQVLSEEDESRVNEVAEDLNDNQEGNVAVPLAHQAGPQKQQQQEEQQQPPGPIIRWERFLTVRTLKVLLVENDDSTRQVVSALLRNCSYEVTAVANGLQAWKILEDLTNHIDLVLTEVVMPCLSGISLLSKIMSHKTCKNIPVIMMSSNDSMGTVFKCLSQGAVDFLVKPIRKNELKNLWQHVWRRYHSSSGSESGIQTQKIAKSKSADDSDNYSGSNDEDDNGSIGLNVRDGSDNGSGTQSSWTKRAVEVDSPQPMSPSDQLAEPPDSTCAQVIHLKPETFCNDWVPMTANAESKGQKEHADDFMGKDLEIGVPRNPDTQYELYPTEQVFTNLTGTGMDKMPESNPKHEGALGLDSNNVSDEPSTEAADLIGAIANSTDAQLVTRVMEAPNGFSKIAERKDKTADGTMELPSLELSLKRLRSAGEGGTATHDDRNVLRRSDLSAFSRYHTSATSNQATTGYGGSCSPLDNSSEAVKTESTYNMISISNAAPLKQGSNGSSDNNDMGSTTKNVFSKPVAYKEKTASTSAVKCIQPSAFHPMQFRSSGTQQVMQEKVDGVTAAASIGQPGEIQCQVQVQHHHHHHYHHHHLIHSMQQQQPPDHDDLSLKNMAAAAPQCGSSNMFAGPVEGKSANYSINGSNSGSNHGSNVQNGSSTAVNAVRMNMEIANGNIDRSRTGSSNGSGSRSGSGVDQSRLAQREAALKKFRQKRKERNFGKKVRYQSRKRLAEQRPRVRGQFVRQSVQEQRGQEADR